MAKVHINLARSGSRADTGSTLQLANAGPVVAKTIESSGVSQDPGLVAEAGQIWTVTVSGGPIWATFANAPVAQADAGWMLGDGETRSFAAAAGQRIAVRDVA